MIPSISSIHASNEKLERKRISRSRENLRERKYRKEWWNWEGEVSCSRAATKRNETRDTQGEGKIGGCRRRWKEDGVRRRVARRDGKWKGSRNYLERHCVCRPEGCKHLISHSNSVAQSDPLLLKRHIKRDGPSPFFRRQKEQSMGRLGRILDRSHARK